MIQGILIFKFVLNQTETGEFVPEFRPIKLIFNNEKFTEANYSELIVQNDIFGIFYQHTTGIVSDKGVFSNFYSGRLKETSFQIMSYFRQETDGSQYITIAIFELADELEIFLEIIKNMAESLNTIFETLVKINELQQISLLDKMISKFESEIKFAIFQIDRLSELDKIQKAALIFHSKERLKILELLREKPISKKELKNELEKIKENPNVDVLLDPFLELNLIKRDWIKGKRDKQTGIIKNQGEYLFLTKDIFFVRIPNIKLLNHLKEINHELYPKYEQKVVDFFSKYDPNTQSIEETKYLASILLNPDVYDFFVLMRNKYYPLDKMPNIFSEFADTEMILNDLKESNVIIEIKDKSNRSWIFLLTDIKPLIFFPEYLLLKVREAYKNENKDERLSYEIAKKALDLLEVAYPEKVEF